ncbi:hypothetical protein UY3_11204 [Chelonia mydas]|uniref:Uncharacterized protein n=1 Tax=Chelonia mydas TaxID=8469 RepID=M7BU45_CHEMY|nr:hypothetical protein UY3_11204 [Chelonia mydas]
MVVYIGPCRPATSSVTSYQSTLTERQADGSWNGHEQHILKNSSCEKRAINLARSGLIQRSNREQPLQFNTKCRLDTAVKSLLLGRCGKYHRNREDKQNSPTVHGEVPAQKILLAYGPYETACHACKFQPTEKCYLVTLSRGHSEEAAMKELCYHEEKVT